MRCLEGLGLNWSEPAEEGLFITCYLLYLSHFSTIIIYLPYFIIYLLYFIVLNLLTEYVRHEVSNKHIKIRCAS